MKRIIVTLILFQNMGFSFCQSLDSDSSEKALVFFSEAHKKYDAGDFKSAISLYSKAIMLEPDAISYRDRGIAKQKVKDFIGAKQDFIKAIELFTIEISIDPENKLMFSTYLERANLYAKIQKYEESIIDYTKTIDILISLNNGTILLDNIYELRGVSKQKLSDYRGAIEDYSKSIEINPNNSPAYYKRGFCQFEVGNKSQGCLDLSKAGELGNKEVYPLIRKLCK
jgi:tetratricopeptide (TPR) repeat protein